MFIALVLMVGSKNLSFAEQGSAPNESRQNLESSEDIEKKAEADSENGKSLLDGNFFGIRARVDGGLELNYEYLDVEDVGDEDSDSSSDFFVSTAELVLRLFFNDYSKAKIVGAAEDFGKQGEDGKMRLDEAILTLKSAQPVFYLVVGKRVMPFGVFEDRLIEGTLNEDLYEIDEWGATVGVAPDYYGLDISFSIYRDTQIIDNLKDFDTLDVRPGRQKDDRFRSFIANLSLEPVEDALNLSFFYNSEPGDGRRNQSLGAAASIHFWNFTLDAEYITALEREAGENQEENKESAVVAGLAWNAADALQLVSRYEIFRDDTRGDQDEVLDYRIIAGFNCSLSDWFDISFVEETLLAFEYRYSKFEKEVGSEATDSQNMVQVQLSFEF